MKKLLSLVLSAVFVSITITNVCLCYGDSFNNHKDEWWGEDNHNSDYICYDELYDAWSFYSILKTGGGLHIDDIEQVASTNRDIIIIDGVKYYMCLNKTLENIKTLVYKYYTGKLADRVYDSFTKSDLFIERDGIVYINSTKIDNRPLNEYYRISWDSQPIWWYYDGVVENKNGKVEVEVRIKNTEMPQYDNDDLIDMRTVKLKYTKDGWKVYGGTFFELVFDDYTDSNPATGEDIGDIILFAILGAVSLAAVTVLAKKKRT